MSAATKAMAPCEHELSQMVGMAIAAVALNPALVLPLQHEFVGGVLALEILLLDFDADCEDAWEDIERQLEDWRAELDWADYQVIGAAA